MPKVRHILPTVGSDITLNYPSSTGTIALTSDITTQLGGFPPQTFTSHGAYSCVCSGGFWENIVGMTIGSIPNNSHWRIQLAARCNKFTGSATGHQWLLRWFDVGRNVAYSQFTVPLGTATYDWLIFDTDITNTVGSTNSIVLQSSKSVAGGVTETAFFKSTITKYY